MTSEASINRREFVAGLLAAPVASGATRVDGALRPPNVLFILADDLGHADLSCYGNVHFRTPHIDTLARQGVRLDRAYANSSLCSPTRIALLTGRWPSRLPAGNEEPLRPAYAGRPEMGIPAQHPTLASYLGDLGYYTALVGKWHAGYGDGADPMSHGYREFFGYNDSAINYYTHRDDAGRPQLLEGATTVEREGYVTDLLTERAVRIIRARCRKDAPPLFLSLHHAAPHWPWLAPGDQVEARRIRRRSHFDGGSLQTYAHMIESLDRGVGEVLAALEASGAARDTLVVFTSDNGGERFSDLWPLRGGKGSLLEGGIRVPALLRWPARLRSGRSSDIPNITMDLTATILAAAGVTPEIPYALDGIDLQPLLTGDAPPPDRILHWRMKARAQAACVAGNWKYLRIEGNEFLFDLGADPREVTNRRSAEPARFERLKSAQQKWESEMLPLDDGVIPYGNSAADLAS